MDADLQILKEACVALACLDADRLEEMAASCRMLTGDQPPTGRRTKIPLECAAGEKQFKVLRRILEKTRDNLKVIRMVQRHSHRDDGLH